MTMAVRCSAEQIADFVALLGLTGTFPEYCEYADDARELKSLDLIISTMDAFVEAFCFSFEDIYRKYKVNLPLSEEKFIEFLKPRCLLLTKDNSCFSFILVCAFVHDTIHSFSNYNKCFHLVKVASKCLAAILRNRFKKIFETDSAWEELMSFCIKIHDLVYPPGNINEYDGNQLDRDITDETEAMFLNMVLGLVGKYATDDNDDDLDTKTTDKKSCTSIKNDLATKCEVEKSEDLNISKFPTSSAQHRLLFVGEGSSLKIVDENNARRDNEKDCLKDSSLPDLPKEFTTVGKEKMSIKKNVTEKLGQNATPSFEDYLDIKREPESLEDLSNMELPLIDATHTFQPKVEDSSPEEEGNKKNIGNENDGKKDNEKNCVKDMTDSAVSNFEYLKSVQGLLHLSNLKFDSSTGESHTYHTSGEDFSPNVEYEDNKKVVNENNSRDGNGNLTFSIAPDLTHKLTKIYIENDDIDKNLVDTETHEQMGGCSKKLNLPLCKDSSAQNATKKLVGSHYLESEISTDAHPTNQLKCEEFALKNEGNEEPFDIRCTSADKVCTRITDNPQHLLEIMKQFKICEENIEPTFFSPDECDIPINDNEENAEMEESSSTSESCSNGDEKILESIKATIFYQNVKMANATNKMFPGDNPLDDKSAPKAYGSESSHEMSDEVASEYGNQILKSDDPCCSLCIGGMDNFFDACVFNFSIKYSNNDEVSDLFALDLLDDSE